MKKNPKNYEAYLNELYFDSYSESQAFDNFEYLTNKSRGKSISKSKLMQAYHARELGTILRKYDPIAFQVGLNDWSR